jgi:ATPase subunit of ABC transporter with duplicated ATPase domains
MAPPLVQLKDIALTFGGTPLLAGVELSVSATERVCLVGRNGSGKSTLLKIAAGLIAPDRGTRFMQPRRDRPLSAAGARLRRRGDDARLCGGRIGPRR